LNHGVESSQALAGAQGASKTGGIIEIRAQDACPGASGHLFARSGANQRSGMPLQ
jgi:hypothetical protein